MDTSELPHFHTPSVSQPRSLPRTRPSPHPFPPALNSPRHATLSPPASTNLLLLSLLSVSLAGCIEERLSVELHTQLHADGTCTRRVEYLLERIDTEQGGARVAFFSGDSPLRRLHSFPSGEEWRIEEETAEGFHRLVIEATLPSPNDFDGDFFRARDPKAPPARNFISAYTSVEDGIYDYHEVFRDPMSPLAGMRALARQVAQREGEFARRFAEAFGGRPGAPPAPELGRAFRELFADPLVRDLSSLASRPLYGPRERRAFDAVVEGLEVREQELGRAVQTLAPEVPVEDLDRAVEEALDALGEAVLEQGEEAGISLELFAGGSPIQFRATLVMPFPVRRCNACVVGDTVVWEFDEQDLYGRGFEMMALASAP